MESEGDVTGVQCLPKRDPAFNDTSKELVRVLPDVKRRSRLC